MMRKVTRLPPRSMIVCSPPTASLTCISKRSFGSAPILAEMSFQLAILTGLTRLLLDEKFTNMTPSFVSTLSLVTSWRCCPSSTQRSR